MTYYVLNTTYDKGAKYTILFSGTFDECLIYLSEHPVDAPYSFNRIMNSSEVVKFVDAE